MEVVSPDHTTKMAWTSTLLSPRCLISQSSPRVLAMSMTKVCIPLNYKYFVKSRFNHPIQVSTTPSLPHSFTSFKPINLQYAFLPSHNGDVRRWHHRSSRSCPWWGKRCVYDFNRIFSHRCLWFDLLTRQQRQSFYKQCSNALYSNCKYVQCGGKDPKCCQAGGLGSCGCTC